jgi:hypothetical protein
VGPAGRRRRFPNRPRAGRGVGSGGAAGPQGQLGRARGEGAGWAEKGRKGGGRKEKFFLFFKTYFLDEGFHNFNQPK